MIPGYKANLKWKQRKVLWHKTSNCIHSGIAPVKPPNPLEKKKKNNDKKLTDQPLSPM
jgi:hypothetical protein